MRIPVSTYRLQFGPHLAFRDAEGALDYLSRLGITDLYSSPVFKARPGSTHGYDIVDPRVVSDELGGEEGLIRLLEKARSFGLGWVQDIVPNHMALHKDNVMLMDVLEKGRASEFFEVFDIGWGGACEEGKERLLVPILGRFYAEALEEGEIALRRDASGLAVTYYEHRLPLRIESYVILFRKAAARLEERQSADAAQAIRSILEAHGEALDGDLDGATLKRELMAELDRNAPASEALDQVLSELDVARAGRDACDELDELLEKQHFRLAFWKVASEEINYRRFFSINDLISLRLEDERVFELTHSLVSRLAREGYLTGLRVDHIDGLLSPADYLRRLRERSGGLWTVAEKILHPDERLPEDWSVEGTTGYDLLAALNALFADPDSETELVRQYWRFARHRWRYGELIAADKRLIIGKHMAGDIDNLARLAKRIASDVRYGRDFTLYGLRRALVEMMAYFPVYRTYISAGSDVSGCDASYITRAADDAAGKQPGLRHEIAFLRDMLLSGVTGEDGREAREEFIMRFQQYTGPLMAKGLEDTAFYSYNRLISLNEVGSDPSRIGMATEEFHGFCLSRRELTPHGMNTTATHDTKRGEDTRARINVISEIPDEWGRHVFRWKRINRPRKRKVAGLAAPDDNDEYFLYQTLLGSYPFLEKERGEEYLKRIRPYLVKSVREAKRHTAWIEPDEAYEEAYVSFAERMLSGRGGGRFLEDFEPFQRKIAFFGMLNSLSQLLIKLTVPGVPDIYQGSELWDLSLVDPDNRRPVDQALRMGYLDEMEERAGRGGFLEDMLDGYPDGRIKMFIMWKTLQFRKREKELYLDGDHVPLEVKGERSASVVPFARVCRGRVALTLAGRLYTRVTREGQMPLGKAAWGDTMVKLPGSFPGKWRSVLTGDSVKGSGSIRVAALFSDLPVALLENV